MTQFLDKFRGRTTRIGKEGLLQILDQEFKPIIINNEPELKKRNNRTKNVKSIEV